MTEAATLSQAIRERRMKIVFLDPDYLIELLRFSTDKKDRRTLRLVGEHLPDDAFILNITYDQGRGCLVICVVSEAFPRTDPGSHLEMMLDAETQLVNIRDLARELQGPDPVDWTPRRDDVWESSDWGEATVLEERDDGVMIQLKIRGAKFFTRTQFQERWTRVSRGAENPKVREIVGTDAEVARAVADEIRKEIK